MEVVLANADVVTRDAVFRGAIQIRDGRITDVSRGPARAGEDMGGDLLAPGLVDLHTDNLEKHFFPRPNIDWNPISAAIVHDAFCVSLGVTTVFDALSVGSFARKESRRGDNLVALADGLRTARDIGALKATHLLHWRCELTSDDLPPMLERLIDNPLTGALSLMDHTPGQRQYRNAERFFASWREQGMDDAAIDARVAQARANQAANVETNRARVANLARVRKLPLFAHDDETVEHVDAAAAVGAVAAEFPVTEEAARRSRERGMTVIMGGPNLIRGGSYSGNIGVAEVAELGLLDAIASDYVPRSMIESPFLLASKRFSFTLPDAFAVVSLNPARAAGLNDRGAIEPGLRADLIRVRLHGGHPVVAAGWVGGRRVA